MEPGDNRREFHVGPSGQIEVVVPVAQGKTARFLAKSEEQPGGIRAGTDGLDNILAVPVELKVGVGCRDRSLTQRQTRLILYANLKSSSGAAGCCAYAFPTPADSKVM